MSRAARIGDALADVVELRLATRTRLHRLERIERVLRRRRAALEPTVPKRRAAALLGVSVPTLDRWIERGGIPVAQVPGRRTEVPTGPLLDIAVEIGLLRAEGVTRRVLGKAIERVEDRRRRRGRLTGVPMGVPGFYPDQTIDRRSDFETMTEAERVLEAIGLSKIGSRLAVAGARTRARS